MNTGTLPQRACPYIKNVGAMCFILILFLAVSFNGHISVWSDFKFKNL